MQRQMVTAGDYATPAPEAAPAELKPHQHPTQQLKERYEAGVTLDDPCRREKIGKTKLSKLLKEAGISLRSTGRRHGEALRKSQQLEEGASA